MRLIRNFMLSTIAISLLALTGCEESPTRQYKVGDADRIRFTWGVHDNSWVEMEGKEPSMHSGRTTDQEIIVRRQVESVDSDGSAVMKVTFEKVDINIFTQMIESDATYKYSSTAEKTESSKKEEPSLAEASYKIKIAPDTTVLEIIGLEELRKSINLTEKSTLNLILDAEAIKLCHQRDCARFAPVSKDAYEALVPVRHEMIKAKAIKKTFKRNPVKTEGDTQLVQIDIGGEAIHILPEGWDEPKQPGFRAFVKNLSEMTEFNISGQGTFDLDTAQALRENTEINCTLMLLEAEVFAAHGKRMPKQADNVMFTKIKLYQDFELLP